MPARAAARRTRSDSASAPRDVGGDHEDLLTARAKRGHELRQVFVDALRQHVAARAQRQLDPVPADFDGDPRGLFERQVLNRLRESADLPRRRLLSAERRATRRPPCQRRRSAGTFVWRRGAQDLPGRSDGDS